MLPDDERLNSLVSGITGEQWLPHTSVPVVKYFLKAATDATIERYTDRSSSSTPLSKLQSDEILLNHDHKGMHSRIPNEPCGCVALAWSDLLHCARGCSRCSHLHLLIPSRKHRNVELTVCHAMPGVDLYQGEVAMMAAVLIVLERRRGSLDSTLARALFRWTN
jgi:hypothetical protein